MSRIHVVHAGLNVVPGPIPPEHPFNILAFIRLLTKHNGPGKPSVTPLRLGSMEDVIEQEPVQEVILIDECNKPVTHRIEYARGSITGHDLADNAAPEQVQMLAEPTVRNAPHEPGLIVRLGYEIQGLNAARLALTGNAALPGDLVSGLEAEETRIVACLDAVCEFERHLVNLHQ
jgi:hypothetical protein